MECVESKVTLKENDTIGMGIIFKKKTLKDLVFSFYRYFIHTHIYIVVLLKFFIMEIVQHVKVEYST